MMRLLGLLTLACLLPLSGGCAVIGYAAAVIPGPGTKARYAGLANQKVAVMSWADRSVTYDFGSLPQDVSMGVQNKLVIAANPKLKTEELTGTTFCDPRQVFRWQKNHPELENRSVQEVAPKLAAAMGCTRLVYVELSPFSIYDPRTPILLKGYATVTVRVVEVTPGGGDAKVMYEETGVNVEFPEKSPEGLPPTDTITPTYIYKGLVDKITTAVARRFFGSNPGDDEE